jgi:hypothetical protein
MKKVVFLATALLAGLPAWGLEKGGMPDLAQIDQTCLPTSTANLMIWFGKHGYPKLILSGDTEDDREAHTVHMLMADTGARYDIGTEMDAVTKGIETYIHDAGYACDVEYRGLEGKGASFTPDWLRENDKPDKGFILLLTYCQYHPANNSFVDAWNAGHAVTLVNAEPDMLLIHDPAHESDETGRKIVTPLPLKDGVFQDENSQLPVAGLMMLTGSLLEAPPDSAVMLTGAVCVTMRAGSPDSPSPDAAPNTMLAGAGGAAGPASTPATATASAHRSWWSWCLSFILGN